MFGPVALLAVWSAVLQSIFELVDDDDDDDDGRQGGRILTKTSLQLLQASKPTLGQTAPRNQFAQAGGTTAIGDDMVVVLVGFDSLGMRQLDSYSLVIPP